MVFIVCGLPIERKKGEVLSVKKNCSVSVVIEKVDKKIKISTLVIPYIRCRGVSVDGFIKEFNRVVV